MNELFHRLAVKVSNRMGSPRIFVLALIVIIVWAFTGPVFGFSDTWQLIINTGTTIVTFLMVFLIQNTQNRDAKAMQLKLDELIRSSRVARDELVDLEDLTDEELSKLADDFHRFHEQHTSSTTKLLHQRLQTARVRRHNRQA
ncbi:MAG: low affinity iron permease family protein [Acidobacteriota bacterium]